MVLSLHRLLWRRVRVLGIVVSTAALLASLLLASTASLGLAVDDQVNCGVHPLDVVLIIDRSGSMQTEQSGGHTRNYWSELAANQLVDDLDGNGGVGSMHHVGITTFGGVTAGNNLLLANSNATAVHNAINAISASGNTPLKLGLATGAANMVAGDRTFHDGVPVLQVLILLSDGRPVPDPAQRPNADEITAYLGSADVAYSIAIGEGGSDINTQVDLALMQILDKPNGAFRHVVDADDLPSLFGDIFTELTCPQIGIEKTPSVSSVPAGGGPVTYTYEVTNSNADAPLSNVSVIDDKCAPVNFFSGDTNTDAKLQSSETWIFKCSMTLTVTTHNVATASGVFNNVSFTAQDTADVAVSQPTATPTPTPTPVQATPTPTPTPTPVVEVQSTPTPTPTPTPVLEVQSTPTPTPEQSVQGSTPAPSLPNSATGASDGSSPLAAVFILIAFGSLLTLPLAHVAVARRRR